MGQHHPIFGFKGIGTTQFLVAAPAMGYQNRCTGKVAKPTAPSGLPFPDSGAGEPPTVEFCKGAVSKSGATGAAAGPHPCPEKGLQHYPNCGWPGDNGPAAGQNGRTDQHTIGRRTDREYSRVYKQIDNKLNTMNTPETYTYTQAFEELQQIVREIERGEILIDELSERVKRAKDLIEICKTKLSGTEADVNRLLANLAGEKSEDSTDQGNEDGSSD